MGTEERPAAGLDRVSGHGGSVVKVRLERCALALVLLASVALALGAGLRW
jgi:hypothetical protein